MLFVGAGVAAGVLLAAEGAQNAKRYCGAIIPHGTANINRATIGMHKGLLE